METQSDEILELGGREYKTVKLNNKIWMAENLSLLVSGSWFYNENAQYGATFGRLYTWQAAMEACPAGWRLPTREDWSEMLESLGGEKQACPALKAGGESGFEALFAGYRTQKGDFLSIERAADFWTSTEAGDSNAWLFYIIFKKEKVFRIIDDKRCGFSVRYIKE